MTLTACAVGPNYHLSRPTLANFHNAPVASTTAGEPIRLDEWWLALNDPSLTRIVQRALDQNLDLAASLARVTQARAAASAAGANLLPTADLNAQAVALRQSLDSPIGEIPKSFPGYSRDQRLYDVGAQASWEIDLFGGLRRTAQAARAEAQAAEAERLGTRISVSADSADAYLQVRGNQARLTVAEKQVDVDSRLLNLVRVRRARGVASDREVAQAEALLQQARTTIPVLRVDLEAQLNRLDVLMGAQPGTYAKELATAADVPAIPAISSDDRPLDVLRRRPDVIAAERQVAAANARIGVAISDYYPKISLSGVLGFESLAGSNLFSARAFQPVGTGALRWRLFDFGKVGAEVAAARGADAEALARYQQSVLRAAEDVEDAFVTLVQTQLRTRELQVEVASLTRARDLSQQSYVAGVIPLTDVLDSDRQLLVARDDLVGFGATSLADIAREAEVPLGNVYYYFKTKDDIGEAIVELRLAELATQRQRWNEAGSPKDRLCACVQGVFENKDFLAERGCAVGTFCSELHKAAGSVATRATDIFAQHLAWIESQFRTLGKGKDSKGLAVHLLSAMQGVSTLAHSFHDPGLVATETKRLKSWIQSL